MNLKYFLCLIMLIIVSCSTDMDEQIGYGDGCHAVVNVPSFVFDDSNTRTELRCTDEGIKIAWDDNETIGVFPAYPVVGSQAYKRLKTDANSDGHTATFDGGGWKIEPGVYYVAYYPYNNKLPADATHEDIPIDLTNQVQEGYNSLAHIGKHYDYMCAFAKAPEEGDIVFDFKHLTSIIQLNITMPKAAKIASVTISDSKGENVFVEKAIYDGYTNHITPVQKSSSVTLKLKNPVEAQYGETVQLYISMIKTKQQPVDIVVENKDGSRSLATYTPKDLKAGYAYRWNITPTRESRYKEILRNDSCVDLGLSVKWAMMNIGASLPEDFGNYYAWGETKPKRTDKYTENDYKWFANNNYIKYTIGGIEKLLPEDDAATQNWGGKWRMPTTEEWQELALLCDMKYVTNYEGKAVSGFVITGENGNSIFFPNTGFYAQVNYESYSAWENYTLIYWSSELYDNYDAWASRFEGCDFFPYYGDYYMIGHGTVRYLGAPVRAVREK